MHTGGADEDFADVLSEMGNRIEKLAGLEITDREAQIPKLLSEYPQFLPRLGTVVDQDKREHLRQILVKQVWAAQRLGAVKRGPELKAGCSKAEVKQRIYEIMRNPCIAALATVTKEGKPWVRYVVASTDKELNITIGTSKLSKKCTDVLNQPLVHLCYKNLASEADIEYVQIEGKASILSDTDHRSRFWSPMLWLYFSGPQDPNYVVFSIRTHRAELWNIADLKLEMAPLAWEP